MTPEYAYLKEVAKKASERIKWAVDNGHSEWWLDTAKLLDEAVERVNKSESPSGV